MEIKQIKGSTAKDENINGYIKDVTGMVWYTRSSGGLYPL